MALVKIDTLHCYRRTNLVLTLRNCWQIYTWMGVEHFCSPESKGNVISQHSAKDPNVNQYLSWVRHKQQEFKPSCTASSWSGTLLVDSGDRYQTITLNQGYGQAFTEPGDEGGDSVRGRGRLGAAGHWQDQEEQHSRHWVRGGSRLQELLWKPRQL